VTDRYVSYGAFGPVVEELQTLLVKAGYPVKVDGNLGAKTMEAVNTYRASQGQPMTQAVGEYTFKQLEAAARLKGQEDKPANPTVGGFRIVPPAWMPQAKIKGVIVHWTAGQNIASGLDKKHYHILIEGNGGLVKGNPSISDNDARGITKNYAAHTLGCNTGYIGVSLCGMAGAVESPFYAGKQPINEIQWHQLSLVLADLCQRYALLVRPETVLSHAEVQMTLGKKQRGKWDISRLPWTVEVKGAFAVGELFRQNTRAASGE